MSPQHREIASRDVAKFVPMPHFLLQLHPGMVAVNYCMCSTTYTTRTALRIRMNAVEQYKYPCALLF